MPTFATPGPIAATVQVAGARVRLTASDRTDTVVLVEPINAKSRSDVKVATRTKVEFDGGRLSVKTTVPGDRPGSVAIAIDLPAGSSLVTYLAHSSVHADGSLGDCELHLASGRVELDRVEVLQANIAAGDVAIAHLAGARPRSTGRAGRSGSATPRRISISAVPVAVSTSTAPTAALPPRPPVVRSGSASPSAQRPRSTSTASEGRCATRCRRKRNLLPPRTGSRSTPARGTATSSSNAWRPDLTKRA